MTKYYPLCSALLRFARNLRLRRKAYVHNTFSFREQIMDEQWELVCEGLTKVFTIDINSTVVEYDQSGVQTTRKIKVLITRDEYIQFYTLIYKLCNSKMPTVSAQPGEPQNVPSPTTPLKYIYDKLFAYIENYTITLGVENQLQVSDMILKKFDQLWLNYKLSSIIVSNLFNYVNRIWVKPILEKNGNILEIHRLTQVAWITYMIEPRIEQLVQFINTLINSDRDGNCINTQDICNFIQQLLALGGEKDTYGEYTGALCIYRKYFETHFIANTKDYYKRRANELIQQNDITGYMLVIADWITAETKRANTYLHNISHEPISKLLEDTLIRDLATQMVAELPRYLTNGHSNEIGVLYTLMKRIDNVQLMSNMFGEFIKSNGIAAIAGLADDDSEKFMAAVLNVYTNCNNILSCHFKSDVLFVAAFDQAHRAYINNNAITIASKRSDSIASITSKYADAVLRGSIKISAAPVANTVGGSAEAIASSSMKSGTNTDDDVEIHLENIISVFKYLEDKDIFQKFYSKYLAKRLISGKIITEDTEKSMISKFKTLCGMEFTSRFQTMITDLTTSRELLAKYKHSELGKASPAGDVLVLTSGSWPIQASTAMGDITLPIEMQTFVGSFIAFYNTNTQCRKLTWLHNMSFGDLQTTYTKSSDGKRTKYTFQASGIQMIILLAYNKQDTFTISELSQTTGIKVEYLTPQLELLVKMKILKLKADTEDSAAYSLNLKYTYKKLKVNINYPIKAEVVAEATELLKSANEDRTFAIQATIVRIMKSRNVLTHTNLISETIQQCSKYFTPKVLIIKKNIDSLIEKEYIKRSGEKHDEYTYVA